MANIEIETLAETCWRECEDFEIKITSMFSGNVTFHKILQCEHVGRCRRIAQMVQEEIGRSNE